MSLCITDLFKEALCLVEDVLQLNQVQQVLLECLLVGIDLLHLTLQNLKLALKVYHVCTIGMNLVNDPQPGKDSELFNVKIRLNS